MERLTKQTGQGYALCDPDNLQEAVRRLAIYENMHQELAALRDATEGEMEKLRAQNRQTSGKFRELLARRLIQKSILDQLED